MARPCIDDYFGGFLIAEFPRIDDKMVVMRIGDVHAEIAADILLTGAIGFFNVLGRILFTELEIICNVLPRVTQGVRPSGRGKHAGAWRK